MNRRTFFSSLFAGVAALPSLAKVTTGPCSVRLLTAEYANEDIIQLYDLNVLFARFNRVNDRSFAPTLCRLGRFEDEQIGYLACSGSTGVQLNHWTEDWKRGKKDMTIMNAPLCQVEIVDADHWCELS